MSDSKETKVTQEDVLQAALTQNVQGIVDDRIKWYATWFGIPNLGVILAVFAYAYFVVPQKAANQAANNIKRNMESAQKLLDTLADGTASRISDVADEIATSKQGLAGITNNLTLQQNELSLLQSEIATLKEGLGQVNKADFEFVSDVVKQLSETGDVPSLLSATRKLSSTVETMPKLTIGATIPGEGWHIDPSTGYSARIDIDVRTSGFSPTAKSIYFTSLGGGGYQYLSQGATSIYRNDKNTGFYVSLVHPHARAEQLVEMAKERKWFVMWIATNDTSPTMAVSKAE